MGHPFVVVDFDVATTNDPPCIWFSTGGLVPKDGPPPAGCLCVFNWGTRTPMPTCVTLRSLGLAAAAYRTVNYWTGETTQVEGEISIPPIPEGDVFAVSLYPASE